MTIQLNRGYKLIIGDFKNGNGIAIEDLQITFDINKSSDNSQSTNSATIEIYNLSQASLKFLQTEYPAAVLYVGYMGELDMLFAGEVIHRTTRRSGADRVTQLQMGSGYTELNYTTVSQTIPAGRTCRDVVEELRKYMPNVNRGVYNGTNLNSQIVKGYPLSGSVREELDTLCDAHNLEWRVDNNVLYVNDKSRAKNENFNEAFVISPSTGLIDIPYDESGNRRRNKDDPVKKNGVQFQMLINPKVSAGDIIKLEDTEITGWFKVDAVRYSGSYRGGNWIQEVNCSAIERVQKNG